jgi:1-acyl-sn-glycerol-3-phosphate acyltransferase
MNVLTVILAWAKDSLRACRQAGSHQSAHFSRLGGAGAVIACNHVGWANSLWGAYAVYPKQLRYMSKQELFSPPSPSSIKTAVDILQHGGVILIFPSGTPSDENIAFKRGAATVALHACRPSFKAQSRCKSRISCTDL